MLNGYTFQKIIAKGNAGKVSLVTKSGRSFTLRMQECDEGEQRDMVKMAEVRVQIKHSHISPCLEWFWHTDQLGQRYMCQLSSVHQENLASLAHGLHNKLINKMLCDIGQALRYFHEESGTAHGDVRATNIIQKRSDSLECAFILGSAMLPPRGTDYCAPPYEPITPQSDIWSLGMTACIAASQERDVRILHEKIDSGLLANEECVMGFHSMLREKHGSTGELLQQMLQLDPGNRMTSAQLCEHTLENPRLENRGSSEEVERLQERIAILEEKCNDHSRVVHDAIDLCRKAVSKNMSQFDILRSRGLPEPSSQRGTRAVHIAAEMNDSVALKILIDCMHADPADRDVKGFTPLHYSAHAGATETMQMLIEMYKVKPESCRNSCGETPLHSAVFSGKYRAVTMLVEKYEMCLNETAANGFAAVHTAATADNVDMLRFLIHKYRADYTVKIAGGYTLLHTAAKAGSNSVMQYLIEELGMNPTDRTVSGSTPLHSAAGYGRDSTVELLLFKYKVNPNLKNRAGYTPLFYAMTNARVTSTEMLKAAGGH
eukprot:TRINITY_DN19876_c0_g1_i1.p1 TRINITY_DN19876_c0_g1~~TRINITY_DN19876_c0_g1_i1.p1  ORF type:complete len:564 (+),score=71.60 TRINITY_DN19876_c0_g1_i1:60-1694(+)